MAGLFFLILCVSCSLFRKEVRPYPQGVVFPLEETARLEYEGKIVRTLLRVDGFLLFSTDQGLLYCLDGGEQKIVWKFAAQEPLGCPPALDSDSVFVWDKKNTLYALDISGRLNWKKRIEGVFTSEITVHQTRLYVGTEEGELLALDQKSGDVLWRFKTGGPIRARAVVFEEEIILGSADGNLYFLDFSGRQRGVVAIGSPIRVPPLVDDRRIFLGAEDFMVRSIDLKTKKTKWKVKLGGRVLSPPRTDDKRLLFIASNSVLHCLNKKRGDILWWRNIPSRSSYDLEFADNQVLVTSFSSFTVGFNRENGRELGRYEASSGIESNSLWFEPYLLVNIFDLQTSRGNLVYLRKEVKVELTPSLESPQEVGTEINFSASSVGFYLPRFEFFLRTGEGETVVQKESERRAWIWFPEKEGAYKVTVRIRDEKQSLEKEIPYEIVQKGAQEKIKKDTESKNKGADG